MRTHKLKAILIAASILALGAGVFAGMAVSRLPASVSPVISTPARRYSVADQLKLSDSQRDQMRNIWESVRANVHQTMDHTQLIQRDRDAAILAMLTDSQKARYAALTQQASEQISALLAERDQAFQSGVAQTRKILDDQQRETYDRLIHDRVGSGGETTSGATSVVTPTTEPVVR